MNRISYLMRKFAGNIVHRPLAALGSILSFFLLFLLFNLFWISSLTATAYYDKRISDIDIELFLSGELSDSVVVAIQDALTTFDGVKSVRYISRESARQKLHEIMGVDLLEELDENPLPRSIILSFEPNYLNSQNLASLTSDLDRLKGVEEISYPGNWLEKTESTKRMIGEFLVLLGIVIAIAVMLNSVHSIILSTRTKAEELSQLKLLGFSPAFLSIPFIMEGLFYTLTAAVAGWLGIHYGHDFVSFKNLEIVIPGSIEMAYFCLVAAIVGTLGGYIGISRRI